MRAAQIHFCWSPMIKSYHNMTSSATSTTAGRRHVAMCPFPFSSHPASMLLLSRKIAASAPDVHISLFTTESSATALSMSTEEGGSIRIVRIDSGLTGVEPAHPVEQIKRFAEAAGESLRKGMAAEEEEVGVKIGCVVAEAMMSFVCGEIAEERGVKWVALWTASAGALAAHLYTDQLRKGVGPEGCIEDASVDRYIPGFPPNISLSDLPHEILGVDYSFPMARILHLMSLHLPKAAAVAVNSFDTLEPAAADILNAGFGNKFLGAGPYTITMTSPGLVRDPQSCLPWLDTHVAKPASVLYISFGSAHNPPPEEFTSLAEALEETRVPFLWSLPSRFESHLPQGFKERTAELGAGKVVTWAPQTSVLGHAAVGAHLTHCGWKSVMESVVCGVPLVCRPLGIADNALNRRMARSVWGIGVDVEGGRMTKAATVVALERVMRGEEGRRAREKINEIKRLAEEVAVGISAHNLNKFITIITG